jgi:hypothetical protein
MKRWLKKHAELARRSFTPAWPALPFNPRSALHAQVWAAGTRLKWSGLIFGLSWWTVVCLGLWLALFTCDGLLNLPAGLRLPLTLGAAVFTLWAFLERVLLPLLWPQTVERTALILEQRFGIQENLLINAVQFQGQRLRAEERPFADQTIASSERFVFQMRLSDLWNWTGLLNWASAAAGVLILWLIYAVLFPNHFRAAAARFSLPLGDVPPVGRIFMKLSPDSDVTVSEGGNMEVTLRIEREDLYALKQPPTIIWREKVRSIEPLRSAGDAIVMEEKPDTRGVFVSTFANVQRPFAFRVFAESSYTRSVHVAVQPLPHIRDSVFHLAPPVYTGLKPTNYPGPPAAITALPGSNLEVTFAVDPPMQTGEWVQNNQSIPLSRTGSLWTATTVISAGGPYQVKASYSGAQKPVTIAQADLGLLVDNPPEVDFITDDRNRFVQLGDKLKLQVQARDDFGLQAVEIDLRTADQDSPARLLKRWMYLGPPGQLGPLTESWTLEIESAQFHLGTTYLLEALARDWRPQAPPSRSRPIVLRVKGEDELTLPSDDPLAPGFAKLKQTISRQEKANELTSNLKTYLEEALAKKTVAQRQQGLTTQQQDARNFGQQALSEFRKVPEARALAEVLDGLVEGEMNLALHQIGHLHADDPKALLPDLSAIEKRQSYILTELLALLGNIERLRDNRPKIAAEPEDKSPSPPLTAAEAATDLAEDLKKFSTAEQRVLERSKTLLDHGPQDLTEQDEKTLGDLAREEAEWAKFFEEKLTDFSKLPLQDFADGSLAKELNSVFQEIKLAEKSLYASKVELAVPHEQSGLENAKELLHNLDRWLPDTPDTIKWNMEEPLHPADVALAELPSELEDIVGDLIDKEQEMTKDVEDVTSPWMDSADKGVGWDAMDGPISNMSAKGVTGNLLPNQNEIGGRAGEGRSGRSQGQMVADTAEGKGGRETPTRLSPSPFEQGSVKDSAKDSKGGATGGGKLAGGGAEGLRGPVSPAITQKMPRLAERQTKLRQEAEALALKLRHYHVPTGDLETSIAAMKRLEESARKIDGLNVRRAYSRIVDGLDETKSAVRAAKVVNREQTKLPGWMRDEIKVGVQDGVPAGYEEMASEYFRALAETKHQ